MIALTQYLTDALLFVGAFLLLTGALGFLRFPDFYTRIHACGVTETLAAFLILLALFIESASGIPRLKLLFILLFTLFSGPTASHAVAKAAWNAGLRPRDAKGEQEIRVQPERR